ncbi:MAG: hypothetical protein L0H26_04100, partial [Microlunatus sp.]|nr:hypothetical protein [Microlunatus sp.]
MPDSAELRTLRTARGRPYRIDLPSRAEPVSVITAYASGSPPIVLWGSWFGGEVIIGVDPLVELTGLDATGCWSPLSVWPRLDREPDGLGGGWFVVLGYDPATSWLGFCDALLRRRADGTWVFESLGLAGREEATSVALNRARAALAGAHGAHGHEAAG